MPSSAGLAFDPLVHEKNLDGKPPCPCRAGLAFFNLSGGAEAVEKRLALLFFILLLFELLPFCYMSFYVADRRFFAADVSNDLYHPSAYYISAVIAGGGLFVDLVIHPSAYHMSAVYRDRGFLVTWLCPTTFTAPPPSTSRPSSRVGRVGVLATVESN